MQQHVLDDGIRTLAVLNDLVEIAAQCDHQFGDFGASLFVNAHVRERLLQLINQFSRHPGEIVDEIERVLDFMRDAGCQLTKRGQLLRLHQAVLCGTQILQ